MGAQLSLYETLGGERALEAVVVRFYRRVLADPRLKPFFAGADMTRLKAMQRAFLAMALGGRGRYSGPSLEEAPARLVARGLNDTHFDRVAQHLAATLDELGVPAKSKEKVMTIVASTRDNVLGRSSAADAPEPRTGFWRRSRRNGNGTSGPESEAAAAIGHLEERIAELEKERDAYRQMVEQMPVNVMTCDLEDFKIDYVNESTRQTLKRIERLLPIKAEDIGGASIDVFHKNPAHQRKILSDPKNLPYRAQIKLGDEVLDLLVSPLRDAAGHYLRPMLTWSIVTEKVKADERSNRLTQMIEQMPINVMTCDPHEFKINYINQTSKTTLKAIEHLLPCKVSEVEGQSIDIFHKNPAHQRKILGDPRNLPHNAKIKLGDETLDLRVSAITGKNGEYLGPMVTWNVITKQVRLADAFEKNVLGVVETVSSASTEMRSSAEAMTSTAEETSRQSTTVAAASEQASTNVQTVASAAEELASSVAEIGRQVAQSTKITKEAVNEAERTSATVKSLTEAAQKIGEVVNLINDIASQTNLLALNATIEAARAGETGQAAQQVLEAAQSLSRESEKLRGEVERFLVEVRAM